MAAAFVVLMFGLGLAAWADPAEAYDVLLIAGGYHYHEGGYIFLRYRRECMGGSRWLRK